VKAFLAVAAIAVLGFLIATGQNTGSRKADSPVAAAPANSVASAARDYAVAVNQTLAPNSSPSDHGFDAPPAPGVPQQDTTRIQSQSPAYALPPAGRPTAATQSPSYPGPADPARPDRRDPQQEARKAIEANTYKREVESLSAGLIVRSERLRASASPAASNASPSPAPPISASALASQPAGPAADVRSAAAAGPGASEPSLAARDSRSPVADQSAHGPTYRLFEGTLLETVLTNRLDSSFTGPVTCMVTTGVWSHSRQHLLIPQGAKVLGEARRVTTTGQARLAVVFHRLIMPDGYSVSLDRFTGLSQVGETGLKDQVNHHYAQIFGVSAALGAIAGLAARGTNYGPGAGGGDAFRQGFSQQLSQQGAQILNQFLNVLPTVTIREGVRVKVYLLADLSLPAYAQHQMASDL
jgi:type IV secretion system protein VirB10